MASSELKTLLGYDANARLDDDEIEELSNIIQKVQIDNEHDEENLRKAFLVTQSTLKSVSRKNRENKLQLKSNMNDRIRAIVMPASCSRRSHAWRGGMRISTMRSRTWRPSFTKKRRTKTSTRTGLTCWKKICLNTSEM